MTHPLIARWRTLHGAAPERGAPAAPGTDAMHSAAGSLGTAERGTRDALGTGATQAAAGSPANAGPWLLICPFAGASHGAFSGWRDGAGPGMPAYLATYPGRDRRMSEALRFSIASLAQELAADIIALPLASRQRLVLAGHSMGAQVAFETVLLLEAEGMVPGILPARHGFPPPVRGVTGRHARPPASCPRVMDFHRQCVA